MRRWLRCLAVASLAASLNGASGAQIPTDKMPRFAIPRMSQPPKLDGAIEPTEWREALAVSGIAQQNPGGNLLIMRPTTYFLAWDPDHLYLACRTWIMKGYKPRVGGRTPGSVNAFDDGMEFNFKPMGQNVPEGKADSSYKFFINCIGMDGDLARVSVGQLFRTWQPKFRTATRLTPEGSAPLGGRWWEAEVAMSTRDFELTGPNRAGDRWKMLLAFNHIPGWMQAAIPINAGYFDPSGFPEAVLAENTPCVQVTMDELPGPLDGVATVRVRAFNPTSQAAQLSVLAHYSELQEKKVESKVATESVDLLKKEATLAVPPGKTEEFVLNEKLPRDLGKNTGSIFYRVTHGDRELLRYFTYFKLGYDERWVKYTPPTAAFPLSATLNPARNNLQLTADTYYLDKPETAKQLRYKVVREGDTKPVAEGVMDQVRAFCFSRILPMPELKEGEYTAEAVMATAEGKELGPVTAKFKKLDEAQAFSAWWKNKLGDAERVIKPFEPVQRRRGTVSVWGRQYALDAVGLPEEIVSQGKAVSAAPARIVAVVGGKERAVKLSGRPKFTEEKPWRCAFKGEAAGAGLAVTSAGCVEQDGLVLVTLTYAPAGKEPVRLDALRIEFPLSGDDAECLNCIGPGGNFASLTHLILPSAEKQGRLWSTLDTGKGGSMVAVGSFYPDVWIGNERRGLLWWADSDQGWVPDDDVPAHEVLRVGRDVVLRNNIVGRPFTLDGPRTITFSYNASPFKPLPKGWRMAIHSEDGTFGGPHKQRTDPKTGEKIDGWNWLHPPSHDPAEWGALWAGYKKVADEAVRRVQPFDPARARNHQGCQYAHTSLPLTGYGCQTADRFTAGYFGPDWGAGNLNPTMRDYLLWLAHRSFGEGGLRTIYWDIFYVACFSDLQCGFGYELPDGRIQPTYHGFNLRQFAMRMYALMQDHGLTPGSQVTHSTNAYPLIAFAWIDAALDGEWATINDSTPRDWVDHYPVERMRPMSIAENYGTVISWMCLIYLSDKERYNGTFRGFMDYQRLHDTWTGQDGRYPPQAVLDWGLNDERLRFVPYWRNTAVTAADKDLLVSTWTLPDRALLVVFNGNGKETKDAQLGVDLAKLGFAAKRPRPGGIAARELGQCGDPGVALGADGRTLSIPGLQPHTARYVGIRTQEKAPCDLIALGLSDYAKLTSKVAEAAVPDAVLDWGMAAPRLEWLPYGKVPHVTTDDKEIQLAMWRLPDRVMLALVNAGAQPKRDIKLKIDLDKLNLVPKLPWQEFIRITDFDKGEKEPPTTLDFYGRTLFVPSLPTKGGRLIGVRRF